MFTGLDYRSRAEGGSLLERMHGWIGRQDRFPVEVDAVVHRADGSQSTALVSNISSEGCRLDATDDFRIGEMLTIAIPRVGRVKAQVRWALSGSAGAKFVEEADL